MIEAEEDEDVVFEGSAIHQHLQSTGYSDYEITQTIPSHRQNNSLLQDRKQKIEWLLLKEKLLDAITFLIWPKELRKSFYKRMVRNVHESRLLISDDQLLLKHFVPHSLIPSGKKPADRSVIIEILLWCMRGLLLSALVIFGVFLSVGESTRWSSIFLASVFTAVVWIATVSWMLYKSSAELEKFVEVLQNTAHLVAKSLRLLLEEDLVSRGFVLAQGSSSFPSRDGREAPHCEGLRQSLHSTLYAMLPVLRISHECLKMFVSYYPCMRGLFDDFEEMDAEQQEDVTEHLKFLKKLVTLVKLQISAVMTELVLCADDLEVFELVLDKSSVFSSQLVVQVRRESDLLSKHLTHAQSFWQKDVNEVQETSCEVKKNNVYIAIHSLSLHMQAALFRIQDIEKRFEQIDSKFCDRDDGGNNLEDLPSYEFVKEQLNSIQIELHSCQGCLDETSVRVDRKYKMEVDTKADIETPVNIVEDVTSVVMSKKAAIPLFELEEPVVKDEVFEAYVDQEYFDNLDKEKDDDFWNTDAKQERRKLKQQKEQGKRVLHELQPLLNQLREVWQERETAALQRQKAEVSQALYGNDPIHCKKTQIKENEEDRTTHEVELENFVRGTGTEKLEALIDAKCISDSVKNNFVDSDSSKLDNFEDSDDERLEVYRRVRKELEMDEKSSAVDAIEERDSDDERLEVYKRIKMELDRDKEQETVEVDSDDERLEVYKRIRVELDKEEEQETFDSAASGYDPREQTNVKFCLPSVTGVGLVSLQSIGESEGSLDDDLQQTKNELNLSFRTLLDGSKSSKDKSDATSTLSATRAEVPSGNVMPLCTLICDDTESPPKDLEEEVFVHGDDIDNDDDSPRIDWSTVTLPSRTTETLEDRMQLFCEGQNRGFHAELAAEAQAASQQFLLSRGQAIQTFRGVGEGEEEFGDDESE